MDFIPQLSIFLQNETGSLNTACRILAENNIDITTLSVADTREYGILRLLVREHETAKKLLLDAGFVVKTTPVLGVLVDDRPGGLAEILQVLTDRAIDVLYMYAFTSGKGGKAVMVFRFADPEAARRVLADAGFQTLGKDDF